MTWYEDEFAGIALKDRRRTRRFLKVVAAWWTHLGPSIASLCQGWTEQMGAYRLFKCVSVTLAAVLAPHRRMTVARVQGESVVLLLQDTSELVYEGKPIARTPGEVGPLNSERRVGAFAHVYYAVTPDRRPLGVLGLFTWRRERLKNTAQTRAHKRQPFEEKESHRWWRGYRTACTLARVAPQTQIVSIADREGDIYEILLEAASPRGRAHYVIRSNQDRAGVPLQGKRVQSLRMQLALAPRCASGVVQVPAAPGRAARTAQVVLRALSISLRPPARPDKRLPSVQVQVVQVREVAPPAGVEPLEWILLTSLPISTVDEVTTIVRYYACRWEIEIFFRLWKSGCHVEAFQCHTWARLAPVLALCAVFAWRLHYITRIGQTAPDTLCTPYFNEAEWKAIALLAIQEVPQTPPTVREVLWWVAKLGGFAGRRADQEPGPLVLMRGWVRVQEAIRLYELLTSGLPS
jgi:hypothetical protein